MIFKETTFASEKQKYNLKIGDNTMDYKKVDVRGVQGNFFPGLKMQAAKMAMGEGLEVIQSFEPIPLYEVMEDMGFEYRTEKVADAEYHTYFVRKEMKQAEKDIPMRPYALTPSPTWR